MSRLMGPWAEDDDERHFGGYFASINRNKRSICLDLSTEDGVQLLRRLVAGADVLVENFRVGVMDRMGLSYEALHRHNPRLVYAAVRGFGDPRTDDPAYGESPYLDWPAYDVIAQAMGGLTAITGPGPGEPMNAGAPAGDIVPALFAALGIVAAVLRARETGDGQFVDVAMYDAVLALCERTVYQHSYLGEVPGPVGPTNPQICPFDRFPTADGFVTIATPGERHWKRLCELMGRHDVAEDASLALNSDRVRRAGEVRAIVGAWTSARTTREVIDVLGGVVPVGPINTIADIVADTQPHRRRMLAEVEQPGSARRFLVAGSPVKMTVTPGSVRSRAPLLGEHTDAVLAEAGFDAGEVERLRGAGTVR
jgi:crotonobetainyl-CoA:carnitine CoA-transferase CaiB-like acyl-CoA transferase